MSTLAIPIDLNSVDSYRTFLAAKSLPRYEVKGRTVTVPAEYAGRLGVSVAKQAAAAYDPIPGLFDYQRDIARLAIEREKFAVFADCGLGKTLILTEFARHAAENLPRERCVLIVSPLMVVRQTVAEYRRFYGESLPIDVVRAADLPGWLESGDGRIGITNYDALSAATPRGRLGALVLDESSMLKSHYGAWGRECLRLGSGLRWKLALTGTPAPNDRIEYANHAVFMDAFPNVNSFLARFFVNRGQTENRWEMKAHAIKPFYRALSHWCIFLNNPATYGWKDNAGGVPPINVHVHEVGLTAGQSAAARDLTGTMFTTAAGGIGRRSKLARIAKTRDSLKPAFIADLVASWPEESTLVWCRFNDEQDAVAAAIPGCASVAGSTPHPERERVIDAFKAATLRTVVTKPKILGFGLNLQVCRRQVFSSLHDSYEEYYQAVKRSNRVGSTEPLDVHVPVTDVELPMVENVLRKAARVQADTEEQEVLFNACRL